MAVQQPLPIHKKWVLDFADHCDFKISAQDERLMGSTEASAGVDDAPLGVLENSKGEFHGRGFNSIFRPYNGQTQPFKIPVKSNSTLELNLTHETICFGPSLGKIPNRGANKQSDIVLNGVPYSQHVHDVTDTTTGQSTAKPKAIHFETGIWMHIPATTEDPNTPEPLCRMASIPHGTTINAQGVAITQEGPPKISAVSMKPFSTIGHVPAPKPSQVATNNDTARLPQDLTPFIKAGTITQPILDNPSLVLTQILDSQKVLSTITFKVSTEKAHPFSSGGGTANINFLDGSGTLSNIHNANVPKMTATFWIETISVSLQIPAWKSGEALIHIQVPAPIPSALPGPTFEVTPPHDIAEPISIEVTYTQLQYRQVVCLVFDTLTWPHISCATLVPKGLLCVPASAFD